MKALKSISLVAVALLSLGCNRNIHQSFFDQIKSLKEENQNLQHDVTELKDENNQLNEQVNTLSGLDVSKRTHAIATVEKITLAKRCGFLDKDKDGTKESLAVYLKPYDGNQDVYKASGAVNIQLWDLEKPSEKAMLGEWTIEPADLGKLWMGTIMTDYYRFIFKIDISTIEQAKPYTLKAKFTDYVSGKVLHTQKVITLN